MSKRGFTLVEIMIVVAIIALLAAIAIPGLLRARLTANESAAQASLRTISTALESWRSTNGDYEDVTLDELGSADPPYIDAVLGCDAPPCEKSGYKFNEIAVGDDNQTYYIWTDPITDNVTGIRAFCVSDDGVVRVDPTGGDIGDRATCRALDPVQ